MSFFIKNVIKLSLQYACITHCIFEYVGDFVVCNGPSMEPTLFSNNVLITERITTRFSRPSRGDIIIAISPLNPEQFICKRIVGVAGDRIISNPPADETSTSTNNSKVSEEEETMLPFPIKFTEEFVPRGHVWIEGDNQTNSADSRYYGPLPLGLIKSRAICRIWPLEDLKLL